MAAATSDAARVAAVLGGSGAVGTELVKHLSARPEYWSKVVLLNRRSTALAGLPRVEEHVVEMADSLAASTERILRDANVEGGAVFITMGVGKPSTVSEADLRRVDVELPSAFAGGAKAAGAAHCRFHCCVSDKADSLALFSGCQPCTDMLPDGTRDGESCRLTYGADPRSSSSNRPIYESAPADLAACLPLLRVTFQCFQNDTEIAIAINAYKVAAHLRLAIFASAHAMKRTCITSESCGMKNDGGADGIGFTCLRMMIQWKANQCVAHAIAAKGKTTGSV